MGCTRAFCYAAAVAASIFAAPAFAQEDTGDNYLELCVTSEPARQLACVMYTNGLEAGFASGLFYSQARHNEPIRNDAYCVPPGTRTEAVRDAFVAWLQRNPKESKKLTVIVFMYAMTDTYPCPKS